MTDTQTDPRVYLLRHGDAKPKDEDPERGLTDAGRTDVTRMAAWAAGAGIQVGEIRHSGEFPAHPRAGHRAVLVGSAVVGEAEDCITGRIAQGKTFGITRSCEILVVDR